MKSEEQIKKELARHKQAIKENVFNEKDKKISQTIVSALEWVLKEENQMKIQEIEKEITIPVKIQADTKELDETINKAKELVSLLEKADKLIQSLKN